MKVWRGVAYLPASPAQSFMIYGTGASGYLTVSNVRVGIVDFVDLAANLLDYSTVSCPSSSETTLFDVYMTLPSARKTVLGQILASVLQTQVLIHASASTSLGVRFLNPGQDYGTGLKIRLYIGGVQAAWSEKNEAADDNATGGFCGSAFAGIANTNLGSSVEVKVTCYHTTGSSQSVVCGYSVYSSPWFLPGALSALVNVNKPQGSTLYITAEPLCADVPVTVGVGAVKALRLGSDCYKGISGGTGITAFSDVFDVYDPSLLYVLGQGLGACISWIASDSR